ERRNTMRKRVLEAAALSAVLAASAVARAHELRCEKHVNGGAVATIDSFPADVTWEIEVSNVNPSDPSTALSVADPMLEGLGFAFTPAAPFTLGVGDSAAVSFSMTIASFDDCVALAGAEVEASENVSLDNRVTVTW